MQKWLHIEDRANDYIADVLVCVRLGCLEGHCVLEVPG